MTEELDAGLVARQIAESDQVGGPDGHGYEPPTTSDRIAAHMLEAAPDDIEFDGGTFRVRGTEAGKTLQEIALAVFAAHDLPPGGGVAQETREGGAA